MIFTETFTEPRVQVCKEDINTSVLTDELLQNEGCSYCLCCVSVCKCKHTGDGGYSHLNEW